MNSDVNNIYPNIDNTPNIQNVENQENIGEAPQYMPPPITIPQYSVPQYSVPQYTVPQYQEPQENLINNYPTFRTVNNNSNENPETIVQQQEPNYQNQNQNQNQVKNNIIRYPNSLELFSFFTWILYMSCRWDIYRRSVGINNELYRPILYNRSFVQLISLIISFLGFLVYLTNIIYKKNENLYQALFNQFAKYHCVAFILFSGLAFTIERQVMELNMNNMSHVSDSFSFKAFSAFYMIFSLTTLCCIIFVYVCTNMACDWYIVMTIKKGIYSIIIAETVQYFFDSIFMARLANIAGDDSAFVTLNKTGGIIFCILVFALVCTFAIIKKDIIMIFINFLMYCGMIFNFYTKAGTQLYGSGIPVVCIIVLVCQFVIMTVMIIKFKEQLIES